MEHVLVLISNDRERAVTPEVAAAAGATLPGDPVADWLNPGIACDLAFECEADAIADIAGKVKEELSEMPVDSAIVPADGRRKSLLLADMDSTIIGQECIDELGAFTGLGERIADITARAMRGELDFSEALRERVGLMKGVDAGAIDDVLAQRITINPGARTLVATMKAHGAHCALVSGGFTDFTARIAAETGFDENRGNSLVIENGMLSGTVEEPILGRAAKVEALHELCAARDLAPEDAVAVGDGANDLDMLAEAGLGVAIHAKPIVAEAAQVRIDHGDLTALLYLQGYRAADLLQDE